MKKTRIIFLFFLLLCCNYAFGAKVYGNVYDLSLNKVSGAKVEVNTTPQQFLISKDGSYSFNMPNGFYAIKARIEENSFVLSENRNITIKDNGAYVIDLILFPDFDDDFDEPEIILDEAGKNFASLLVFAFLFILGVIMFFIFKNKKNVIASDKKENVNIKVEEEYEKSLDGMIKIIKEGGGRATQKEIRKKIPYSEAKISLMIAELEHKGIIEKIKKGRGNIIIIKRR